MLTDKDITLIKLVLEGKTSKEISKHQHKSVRSIEGRKTSIMRKMGCKNFYEVIGDCLKNKTLKF